jgi:hypothetical protein
MKKLVASLIATGMLVGMGFVLGQTTQDHDVVITLPELVMIRLVDSTNLLAPLAPVTSPDAVEFDLDAEYDADSFDPTGTYGPTNLSFNWDDVLVFSNGGGWEVTIDLTFSTSLNGSPLFNWAKVSVPGMFDLVIGDEVGSGASSTGGWRSLGFGPNDFSLALDGTEVPDTYSVTVTYTIVGGL